MTFEEMKNLPIEEQKEVFNQLKKKRGVAKTVNFAAVYGAGGAKIATTAKVNLSEGDKLHKIYWQRNSAVKSIAQDAFVKKVRNYKWIYNPVSHFYLPLQSEKDRFSAINQSTGVYIFDTFVRFARIGLKEIGVGISLQYHDEVLLYFKKNLKNQVEAILRNAMVETNELLKLNVTVRISTDYGINYADCH